MERKDEWQITGSNYFFNGIDGFVPHDVDKVLLVENPTYYKYTTHICGPGECFFYWKWMTADEFIEIYNSSNLGMMLCNFLIPEFCEKIGFKFEDLKRLNGIEEKIDKKHRYLLLIYNFYIENGGFFLTDEQRMKAFEEYKIERDN